MHPASPVSGGAVDLYVDGADEVDGEVVRRQPLGDRRDLVAPGVGAGDGSVGREGREGGVDAEEVGERGRVAAVGGGRVALDELS